MPSVVFRLYAQLNDHQPPDRRQTPQTVDVPEGERVGDALRGLEVEPAEVGLVLVNGEPAALDRALREGDRVAAYPPFTVLGELPPS
ncbi:MAG TPA: MoaD/ThiS family protein [Myxococcales bacterium]|jgi:hypothetical protein